MAYFGLADSDYGGADQQKGWKKSSCSTTNMIGCSQNLSYPTVHILERSYTGTIPYRYVDMIVLPELFSRI